MEGTGKFLIIVEGYYVFKKVLPVKLGGGVPKHRFRCRVPEHDITLVIQHDNGILDGGGNGPHFLLVGFDFLGLDLQLPGAFGN